MSQLLLLAILLSGALCMSAVFNQKIEFTLPTWIFTIVAILYITSIINLLTIGFYLVLALSLVSIFVFLFYLIKNIQDLKAFLKKIITPGLVFFIILSFISWKMHSGRMLMEWDEFSHWGLAVKNIFFTDKLYTYPGAVIIYADYPPITALFQYFCIKVLGAYIEAYLFQAVSYFYIGFAIYLFHDVEFSDCKEILLRSIFVIFIPAVLFSKFYTCLYVDALLGILFAYILLRHFTEKESQFKTINMALAFFTLTLIKSSGAALALFAGIIITADRIYQSRSIKLPIFKSKSNKFSLRKTFAFVFPFITIIAAKLSWSMHIKVLNVGFARDTSRMTFSNVLGFIFGKASPIQSQIAKNFGNALISKPISDNEILFLPYIVWTLIIFCITAWLLHTMNKKPLISRYIFAQINAFFLSLVYCASLLVIYVFAFSENEALNLASYKRYAATFILGFIYFSFWLLLFMSKKYPQKKLLNYITAFIIILLAFFNFATDQDYSILSAPDSQISINKRTEYDNVEKISQAVTREDRIFFINQGGQGYSNLVANYIVYPIGIGSSPYSYSIGPAKYNGDIWSYDVSPEDWAQALLDNYDYVFVFNSDKYLNENFGYFFEEKLINNKTLYKIIKSDKNIVLRETE